MSAQLFVSILALIISLASFSFAWVTSLRAGRAEEIKNLLGEKETVGFGALKLLRDGLPGERRTVGSGGPEFLRSRRRQRDAKQRELVIGALMAACLFERSDRARALLYKVVEKHRGTQFSDEFKAQCDEFENTIKSMDTYEFDPEEFDPRSAKVRLQAVRKVLQYEERAAE